MTKSQDPHALGDRKRLAELLAGKGLSPRAAQAKAVLLGKAAAALLAPAGDNLSAFFVPGRIEVLGKHTDYAGGRSMIVATEQGFCTVFRPREDGRIRVTDAVSGESVEFSLDRELTPTAGHWANYPMTVARRIARNFPSARQGVDLAFASDLPAAAGMSSSSVMMVAVFLALADANRLEETAEYRENLVDPTALAGYLGTVENGQSFGPLTGDRGVGTFGGSEDHTAILCAQPGRVSQYAYCPVALERVIPLPSDTTFAIGASGVVAEKTRAAREKYNTASRLAGVVAELWRRHTGRDDRHLAAALASSADASARLRAIVADVPPGEFTVAARLARLDHFVTENIEVIPAAGTALERGDLATFGNLVDRSQLAAERLLGNQVPETVYLAAAARRHGATAASAFGAGFGGSVWALVNVADADRFLAAWATAYREQFPQHAQSSAFFATAAGPAAFRVC